MEEQALQRYEEVIGKIAGFYYWPNKGKGDFDLEDLQQVGRMAVVNVSRKRPEKLNIRAYVHAAIRYAIFGEMRKMRHKARHIYLVTEDETVPLVDVLPTRERGEKFDELEELRHHIEHEFSQRDAEGLMRLLENCDNIYDLNLTQPPSTDTKDRVRVVTRMDLNDEEMRVYAEVLLGVRQRIPRGYVTKEGEVVNDVKRRTKKFLNSIINALNITAKELVQSGETWDFLKRYNLLRLFRFGYSYDTMGLMRDIDPSLKPEDFLHVRNLDRIGAERIEKMIEELAQNLGRMPKKRDFKGKMDSILDHIFYDRSHLAIEFAFPGTYSEHTEEAKRIRKELQEKYKRCHS